MLCIGQFLHAYDFDNHSQKRIRFLFAFTIDHGLTFFRHSLIFFLAHGLFEKSALQGHVSRLAN